MEEDKIHFERETLGRNVNKEGEILKEYRKHTSGSFNVSGIELDNKIAIDSMMMTHAILDSNFKEMLIQNIGNDFPHTTGVCKKETIGNIKYKLKIGWKEAKKRFQTLEKEIDIKFLDFKGEYWREGRELFDKVISSGMKIKNKKTLLKDCVNIITIKRNNVSDFFSNDEDLEKICRKFNIKLNFIRIADSNEKLIKNWKQSYLPKIRYRKKGRKARR